MQEKCRENQLGIGLVETVIALGVGVIVITALVSLSVFTLRSSIRGKLLFQGSKLANEQLELVRAYRDGASSWGETGGFVDAIDGCSAATPCYMSVSGSTISVVAGVLIVDPGLPTQTQLSFYVTDEPPGNGTVEFTDDILRVRVRVSWRVSDQIKESFIYSDVSNWRDQ